MPQILTGAQQEQLFEAMLAAFDDAELERLLQFKLEIRLRHVTEPGSFQRVVWQLIGWAGRQGRLGDLIEAVAGDRPNHPAVQRVVAGLRASPAQPQADDGAGTEWHYLHRYPRTGRVPPELITFALVHAFGEAVPQPVRALTVAAANAERRRADPDCGPASLVSLVELPPVDYAADQVFWLAALNMAKLKSPRTLAALLTTVNSSPFGPQARQDLDDLLAYLRTL